MTVHGWGRTSIQTYTGREFFPLEPRASDIDPIDVAHALSMKCRYTGHVSDYYSVAEHCILIHDFLLDGGDRELARWGLMHDASEAYLPDVAGPIKAHIVGFAEIEDRVLRAVAARFDLPWPIPAEVHHLDKLLYWREREALLKDVPWVYQDTGSYGAMRLELTPDVRRRLPIRCWRPYTARGEWFTRYYHGGFGR